MITTACYLMFQRVQPTVSHATLQACVTAPQRSAKTDTVSMMTVMAAAVSLCGLYIV